jgi:hypothetical protein
MSLTPEQELSVQELVGPAVERFLARRGIGKGAVPEIRRAAVDPDYPVLMHNLIRDFRPEWRATFERYHKAVLNPRTGEALTVPRVEGLTYEPLASYGHDAERADQFVREAEVRIEAKRARRSRGTKRPGRKVYKLIDLFTDSSITVKLMLSDADMQVVRRLAALDPAMACRQVETQLRARGHDCSVVPGDYAKGVRVSRIRIHEALAKTSVRKPDIVMEFTGDNAYVMGPVDDRGRSTWTVRGSEKIAPEVAAVARLTLIHGISTVRALFEGDLFKCGVHLASEDGFLSGGTELHYGGGVPDAPAVAGFDGLLLPDFVRAAGDRLFAVLEAGRPVATSVRLAEDVAYVNWHVMQQGGEARALTLACPSNPSVGFQVYQEVGPDVWTVQHVAEPFDSPWVHREADEGEDCVLVYYGCRGPEFSDTVRVVRKEGGSVITTRPDQARKGVSGAALVALSDGSLLGVYRGSSVDMASCAVVAPFRQDALSLPELPTSAVSDASQADTSFDSMVSRGLQPVLARTLSAMAPVYVRGEHSGYTIRYGTQTYTTIDCDVWSLSDSRGKPMSFSRVSGDKFKAEPLVGQGTVGSVRLPRLGERVYIMGNDEGGVYLTRPMVVAKLASDNQSFWLAGDPVAGASDSFVYAGAAAVAEADGAVLGQFATASSTDMGVMSRCVGFVPRALVTSVKRENLVNDALPGAMAELWEQSAVAGLVGNDDAIVARYSQLGQTVLEGALQLGCVRADLGLNEVAAVVSLLSNPNWVGARAYDCGLHKALRPLSGVQLRPAAKLADAFRASMGMLAVWQGTDQVVQTLRQLGWFDFDWNAELWRVLHAPHSPSVAQLQARSRTSSPSPAVMREEA